MRRALASPLAAAALITLSISLIIAGLRVGGVLESLELAAYDWHVRLRSAEGHGASRVTLVVVTERDIQEQGGWPLSDGVLADTLAALLRHQPRAVGLDIYRDIPVAPGTDRLEQVLAGDERVVAITKFGDRPEEGVRPPRVLENTEQVGFNDIVVDPGGTVRRGLLFLDDGSTVHYSLALRLALLHLRAHGIQPEPDPEDPGRLRLGGRTIHPLESDDGGYVGADARGYQFLLDFRDGHDGFPTIDLGTLLAGTADGELVRDRVVLVGVAADSIKDDFYTPYSRALQDRQHVRGVAIHGHAVGQLLRIALDGSVPVRTAHGGLELLWIVLWTAGGTVIGFRSRSAVHLSAGAVGGLVALVAIGLMAFLAGWWIPTVPPAVGWVIAAGVATAYVSRRERVERQALMQLFSRHVSREVAETIWSARDEFVDGRRPRPQRLTATVVFTDLTGFSTVAERYSPEALMDWLNEYMDAMSREIMRHGGVISQYAGDAIMVLFGVPVARQSEAAIADDAARAIDCALAMEARLRELNHRWRAEERPVTSMRVGIYTGLLVAGTLGSAERSEYVVLGDTVNIASRLETYEKDHFTPDPFAHPCRIFIGEPTLALVGDRFETERVGDATLKGKAQKVGVYRVIARTTPGPSLRLPEEKRA